MGWASVLFTSGAVLAVTMGIGGCSESDRVSDASSEPSGVDAGSLAPAAAGRCSLPGSFGPPECNECLQTACCGAVEACTQDADCGQLLECASGCSRRPEPGACLFECLGGADPPPLFVAFDDCVFLDCGDSCVN
jgi:hypothetical protein